MKNLILENHGEIDLPEEIKDILEEGMFAEDREYWYWFFDAFYPENRENTMKRFMSLEEGGNIVCQTVFDGWMQLELVVELLVKLKELNKKVNFHIFVYSGLGSEIQEYLDEYESELVPNTEEYNDDWKLRREFKQGMNEKLREVLEYHNIYDLSNLYHYDETKLLTVDDFTFNIK